MANEAELRRIVSLIDASPLEKRDPKDLLPYAQNSRTHSEYQIKQIADSIIEFGFTNPVLIDEKDEVIAGHGRIFAAMKLELPKVPVIVMSHLSPTQKKAYVIADNKLALNAGWDLDLLKLQLNELDNEQFDLTLTGFDDTELDTLLGEVIPANEGNTDPDAIPEVKETRCKPGDLWQLGNHRLLCGDSTNIQHVERLMGGEKAELCFTSPPYSDQREYNGGKELSPKHLATFIRASFGAVAYYAVNLGISRKNGSINRYWDDYIKEAEECGLNLLSWNIWDRSGLGGSIGNQTAMFPIWHEWILVFGDKSKDINRTKENKSAGSKSGTNRNADGTTKPGKGVTADFGKIGTVTKCGLADGKLHPAMFPVELPETYIEACTHSGEIVYEPFSGSGSTLIACEKTGRKCYGMEIDPHYCGVILARWEQFTGQTAVLVED